MGIQDRKERERDRRRQNILIAARRVFSERGYGNATMENIAMEAELSIGTLYLYFKGKEELYAAMSLRILQYLLIRMAQIARRKDISIEERLENIKVTLIDAYRFDPLNFINMIKLQSSQILQHLSYELLAEIKDLSRKILWEMIEILNDDKNIAVLKDLNPIVFADIIWGFFSGIILTRPIIEESDKDEEYIRSNFNLALEIIIRGLRAKKAE